MLKVRLVMECEEQLVDKMLCPHPSVSIGFNQTIHNYFPVRHLPISLKHTPVVNVSFFNLRQYCMQLLLHLNWCFLIRPLQRKKYCKYIHIHTYIWKYTFVHICLNQHSLRSNSVHEDIFTNANKIYCELKLFFCRWFFVMFYVLFLNDT